MAEALFQRAWKNPIQFIGYKQELSIVIDKSMTGTDLFWERRYLDAYNQIIETRVTAIDAANYGKQVRLPVDLNPPDAAVMVVVYVSDGVGLVIGTENNKQLATENTNPIGVELNLTTP